MEVGDSPNHGLDFCHGCWSEMGPGVLDAIRYFGTRGRLFYVHLRDVQGTMPRFQECFVGEGNSDLYEVVRTLKDVGFTGFLLPDHVPHIAGDSPWGHRARAHAIGYIQALVEAIEKAG
jgi:mannonate dehydratase